ncbi:MAG TPA: DUF2586 family protein [Thermoanaerobaculia bacterium]|nr:DUF2586 family protein [Thermoanaerobaculia bacterium]
MPEQYITEFNATPTPILGVATAVPAFLGYTQNAVPRQAISISSMADYDAIFGAGPRFNLYDSLQLFYANGGATCYVVSVGNEANAVSADDLLAGLAVIGQQAGPTMLVLPDATLLATVDDYSQVVRAMLEQCGTLQDRVAILDVYGGNSVTSSTELAAVVAAFHAAVGEQFLSYGAAYFPFLETTIRGVLPPSGAMAGVFAQVDSATGVWQAPANVSLASVTNPTFAVTAAEQDELNAPADGKAVNAIREFPTRGTVVWGARTLDGNDNDYRYIHVRRTMIYIEQSIRRALPHYAFFRNDAQTWPIVIAAVSNFLQGLWAQGGLGGRTAAEAFSVACGLGTTMTQQDILDGILRVQVQVQILRPAELIPLTFVQKIQGA